MSAAWVGCLALETTVPWERTGEERRGGGQFPIRWVNWSKLFSSGRGRREQGAGWEGYERYNK